MTLYRFVDDQKAEGFTVRVTCSVVGVSPSAYYAHTKRPQPGPSWMRPRWWTRSGRSGANREEPMVRSACALSCAGVGW